MSSKRLYALSLKFKRHRIGFSYDETAQTLQIGTVTNIRKKLLLGISSITISVLLLLSFVLGMLPGGRLFNYIFAGPFLVYGLKELHTYQSLLKGNKDRKIISKKEIVIESAEERKVYKKEDISKIGYKMKLEDELKSGGEVFIRYKGVDIPILVIMDDEFTFLKNDLIFLEETLEEFMEFSSVNRK